jgi:hypothetical protein
VSIAWTLNNYTDDETTAIKANWPKMAKYVCYGKEVGDNGTPHLQGYVSLKKQEEFSVIHRDFPGMARAHFILAGGDHQQNRNYCAKGTMSTIEYDRYRKAPVPNSRPKTFVEGDRYGQDVRSHPDYGVDADFWESGELSEAVQPGKSRDLRDFVEQLGTKPWEQIIRASTEAKVVAARHYNNLKLVEADCVRSRSAKDPPPEIHWIYGDTGLNKTRVAADFARQYVGADDDIEDEHVYALIKSARGGSAPWFGPWKFQPVAVIDDVRAKSCDFAWLLGITDRYPQTVEPKNRQVAWNPEVIICTSDRSIEETWDQRFVGKLSQLHRRIRESGGRVWKFPQDREAWNERLSRLQPRSGTGLADPRLGPKYATSVFGPLGPTEIRLLGDVSRPAVAGPDGEESLRPDEVIEALDEEIERFFNENAT